MTRHEDRPRPDRDILIRQGLKLPQLRLIAALEETGQISGAAAQLSISQPAASRMLAELERTVEAKLYTRHPRGVLLSDAGQVLASRARRILRDLDDTRSRIAKLTSGLTGRVDIGSVTGPALELVLPAIRQSRVTHPEIEINVDVDTSDKLGEGLLAGDYDFYIGRHIGRIDPRAVSLRVIGHEPLSLIVRQGHPVLRLEQPTLADCLGYDWVQQPPGGLMRRTVELHLLEHGLGTPNRVVSTSSLLVTLAIIDGSNAVAPVSASVAQFYAGERGLAGRIRVVPINLGVQVSPYGLVTRRGESLSAAAETFYRMVAMRAGLADDEDAPGPLPRTGTRA